jgi:hypothetical protein
MTIQDRIHTLEAHARGRIRHALEAGNEKLLELDGALARVAKDDWSVPAMRRQLDELRARAEGLRTTAVKRASELPAQAVTKLVTRTRAPVQILARELAGIAKRLQPPPPARPVVVKPEKAEAAKAS